jgi:TPR repeat protein
MNPLNTRFVPDAAFQLFDDAELALSNRQYAAAQELFARAGDLGHGGAFFALATMHRDGLTKEMRKSGDACVAFLRRGAELQHAPSMTMLGVRHEHGADVAKDGKAALDLYMRAAELGDSEAKFRVGFCFDCGIGASVDRERAVHWYEKAAAEDVLAAVNRLAQIDPIRFASPHRKRSAVPTSVAAAAPSVGIDIKAALAQTRLELAVSKDVVEAQVDQISQLSEANSALKAQVKDLKKRVKKLTRKVDQVVQPVQIAADELVVDDPKHLIGSGSSAAIFAAIFRDELVAVKEFRDRAEPDAINAAVALELSIAQQLNGHSNIVTTYGIVQAERSFSLVMERLDMSLADALFGGRKAKSMDVARKLAIAHGVARGLRFCHAHSIIHRDLKPGNVLLSDDLLTVKICDFGSARASALNMTLGLGTICYMAPELLMPIADVDRDIAAGGQYGTPVDVYAFAVLLWTLFSGKAPFSDLGPVQVSVAVCDRGERPSPDPADMPQELVVLMKRCWAAQPEQRPTMAAAIGPMGRALRQVGAPAAAPAVPSHLARNECVVCIDAPRSTVLLPCGHVCMCGDCVGDCQSCPICRTAIESALKVYFS